MENREKYRRHYEIEKELALRLRNSTKKERRVLYSQLYNELFQRVPEHSLLSKKTDPALQLEHALYEIGVMKRFVDKQVTFLEIGAGDCSLSFEISKSVKKVYAVDVSSEISKNHSCPRNFELIISDGLNLNIPPGKVNIAFSRNLVEHLHPDDIVEHLQNVLTVLVKGGVYVFHTPHRFMGPFDISRYFDETAAGFHLKEYTNKELRQLAKKAGFSKVEVFVGARDKYIVVSPFVIEFLESMLSIFPYRLRKKICTTKIVRHILGIRIIATKG